MGETNGTPTRERLIRTHRDLDLYRNAVEAAMEIFRKSRSFPKEEAYALTSQILRSSRSVAANVVEGWRKRRYEAAFVAKLSDAECQAAETRVHLEFAVKCGYLARQDGAALYRTYDRMIRTIVGMIRHADRWLIREK